ncbi:hypothetical protein GCM10023082_64070 [Streptomyces tremellae]|uniref:Uncharacterized protein n=1 Tax=Streptomyces tremellae TaxID=1124239 RepID=A0ABP7GD08_9ACTN
MSAAGPFPVRAAGPFALRRAGASLFLRVRTAAHSTVYASVPYGGPTGAKGRRPRRRNRTHHGAQRASCRENAEKRVGETG